MIKSGETARVGRPVVVVGGGGHARDTIWLARECGRKVVGCLDDNLEIGSLQLAVPVLGRIQDWARVIEDCELVVGIGTPRIKRQVLSEIERQGAPSYATLVHPGVVCSEAVSFGSGSIIAAGVIIAPNVAIGEHVTINLGATIGHDCKIDSYATIAPQAALSGAIVAQSGTEIGTGALIRQGIKLETGSMAGMGAVVLGDVGPNVMVMGNPARPVRQLEPINW